jgi:hypothetical protein
LFLGATIAVAVLKPLFVFIVGLANSIGLTVKAQHKLRYSAGSCNALRFVYLMLVKKLGLPT